MPRRPRRGAANLPPATLTLGRGRLTHREPRERLRHPGFPLQSPDEPVERRGIAHDGVHEVVVRPSDVHGVEDLGEGARRTCRREVLECHLGTQTDVDEHLEARARQPSVDRPWCRSGEHCEASDDAGVDEPPDSNREYPVTNLWVRSRSQLNWEPDPKGAAPVPGLRLWP